MFITALFSIAKTWKPPKCPLMVEWIKELWYIYTQWNIISHKKRMKSPFVTTWMGLEDILSEISQSKTNTI